MLAPRGTACIWQLRGNRGVAHALGLSLLPPHGCRVARHSVCRGSLPCTISCTIIVSHKQLQQLFKHGA